jgi:hypothetical protein
VIAATIAVLVAIASTRGQPESTRRLGQDQFQRVEQGRGDQGPLDGSLLAISRDLRVPNDFSGVYRISADAPSRYAGRFARIRGGLVAVFPQSVYQVTRRGLRAPVPPGTEFFIGGVPRREAVPSAPSPLLVQTQAPTLRLDTAVRPEAPAVESSRAPDREVPAQARSGLTPSDASSAGLPKYLGTSPLGRPIATEEFIRSTQRIMHDEVYRGRRLTALLAFAFEQGQRPATPVSSPR